MIRTVRTPRIPLLLALLCAVVGGLAGCSSSAKLDTKSGASELYDRAYNSMRTGNFSNAIQYFEALEARFPFANETKQAQLDVIYSYYRDRQIEATVDAATNFERENPTHPRVDYALYMRGLAYFSGESAWYHRVLNTDLDKRPPKNVQESYSVFAQLVQRFPKSLYAADARQRMIFLRNRLADYELYVADYYMARGAWLAAANRAQYVVEQYDGAPATPRALNMMAEAYEQLGMADFAADTRRVLTASYASDLPELSGAEAKRPWYKFW
jgi:outer membrane protein assembly factor BamD